MFEAAEFYNDPVHLYANNILIIIVIITIIMYVYI